MSRRAGSSPRLLPDSARIGAVEAAAPLLADPLTGNVYFTASPSARCPA